MTALVNVRLCHNATVNEAARNKEYLMGLVSTGDNGQIISHNIKNIIANRQAIAEQNKYPEPDMKKIARFEHNVKTCFESITSRLKRLGAKPEEITKIISDINSNDLQSVTLAVLKLMAARNPGMYQRQYDTVLAQHQR